MQFGMCPVQGACGLAHPPAISALTVIWVSAMLDGISCAVTPTKNASATQSVRRRFRTAHIAKQTSAAYEYGSTRPGLHIESGSANQPQKYEPCAAASGPPQLLLCSSSS